MLQEFKLIEALRYAQANLPRGVDNSTGNIDDRYLYVKITF